MMIFPCACGLARPRRCDIKGKTINMELDGAGPAGSSGHRLCSPPPLPSLPLSLLRRCVINNAGQKSCGGVLWRADSRGRGSAEATVFGVI